VDFVAGPRTVNVVFPFRRETTINQWVEEMELNVPDRMLRARQTWSTNGESDCRESKSKIIQRPPNRREVDSIVFRLAGDESMTLFETDGFGTDLLHSIQHLMIVSSR
jgi:hypothetical protein